MSIKIDKFECKGCGKCSAVCPGNLIRTNISGKAEIAIPEDCWGCLSCVKECDFGAIRFFSGADIGGRGTTVYTRSTEEIIRWIFEKTDGEIQEIIIDRKDSNAY